MCSIPEVLHGTMRIAAPAAALSLLPLLAACGPDCRPAARNGEIVLEEPALVDDGEGMRLQYVVHNGTGAAAYVHDGLSRIVYDLDSTDLELTLAAPDPPDDIHVFGAELCYRRIPAGCACEVRREVYREYTRLAAGEDDEVMFESLPVHEADRVDLIVAWGDEPLEPGVAKLSRAEYDTWRDELQDERVVTGFDRVPGELDGQLDTETEPTACPWVTFP